MACAFCVILLVLFFTSLCLGQADAGLEAIRLVGGSKPTQGRVEVLVNGQWGTVCDDGFGPNEALVVCRQLGYHNMSMTQVMYHDEAFFGPGTEPVWMDNVDCTGSEDNLADCSHNGFGTEDCSHREDVSVDCDFHQPNITSYEMMKHCIQRTGQAGQVSTCYTFVNNSTTWDNAQRECASSGMELATVGTSVEMEALSSILQAKYDGQGFQVRNPFWLGLRITSSGTWTWLDGSSFPSNGVEWGSGQGNTTNQECGMYSQTGIRSWPCNHAYRFICESRSQAKDESGICTLVVPAISAVAGAEMIIIVILIVTIRYCLGRAWGRQSEEIIAMKEQSPRALLPPSGTPTLASLFAPRAAPSQAPSCSKADTPAGPTSRGNPYSRDLFSRVQGQGEDDDVYENNSFENPEENIYSAPDGEEDAELYEVV